MYKYTQVRIYCKTLRKFLKAMNSTKMIRQKTIASAGRLGNIKSTKENAGQTVTLEKSSKGNTSVKV